MESPKQERNAYFKALGDEFLAEAYDRPCVMSTTHVHSVYELYFNPTSTPHHCIVSGNDYVFDHPAAILTKPYTIHSVATDTACSESPRWYVFSFSSTSAEKVGMQQLLLELLGINMGLLFSLTEHQASHLERIIKFLFDPAYPLEETEALSLFSFFLRRLSALTEDSQITGAGTASYSVQQVMQYICENFQNPLTTQLLSTRFSVSRSKLDRDFKEALGVTPKSFTELCRLHCAQNLLLAEQDIHISAIAQMCGFPSENYFYRFFRRNTGMTPTQYKHTAVSDHHV